MKTLLSFLLISGIIVSYNVFAGDTLYPTNQPQTYETKDPSRSLPSSGEYHPDNPVTPDMDKKMQTLEDKEDPVKNWGEIMSQNKQQKTNDPSRMLHVDATKELTEKDLQNLDKGMQNIPKKQDTIGPDGTSLMKQGGKNPSRHLHTAGDYHPDIPESPNMHGQMHELEKQSNITSPVPSNTQFSELPNPSNNNQ